MLRDGAAMTTQKIDTYNRIDGTGNELENVYLYLMFSKLMKMMFEFNLNNVKRR